MRTWVLGGSTVRGWSAILALVAPVFLLSGCGGAVTHEVCGTVLKAEGAVEISERSQSPFDPIGLDSILCPGTNLRSATNSTAEISCFPNALIHLSEKSALEIETLIVRKDGNETDDQVENRSARCRLLAGRIDVFHRGAEGVAELILSTPHGRVIAKANAVVRVSVDDRKTRVTCAGGMVVVVPTNGSSTETVQAGYVAEWPTEARVVTAAAESALGQQDVVEAFDAGQRLEASLKARPAPWLRNR